jgi:hypothetical protein
MIRGAVLSRRPPARRKRQLAGACRDLSDGIKKRELPVIAVRIPAKQSRNGL